MKEYQNPEVLRRLYWDEGLSIARTAKIFKVSNDTIHSWMKRFNISRRNKRRDDITKNLLEDLYWKRKLSINEIAKKLNMTSHGVWYKMRKFGISRRSYSEANMRYSKNPFSGNRIESAYLLGIRTGDISCKKVSNQILVHVGTTHIAQLKMFKKAFENYTTVKFYVRKEKLTGEEWVIYGLLHKSFDFLIKKPLRIPNWILNNTDIFFSFLAGYADAEGCWRIYSQKESKLIGNVLRIRSTDKIILKQMYRKLKTLGFNPRFILAQKKGRISSSIKSTKDQYELGLNIKNEVFKLANILLRYSKHEEKVWKMKFIINNSGKDWEGVKDEFFKFKKSVQSTLLKNSTSPLLSLRSATIFSDEYSH